MAPLWIQRHGLQPSTETFQFSIEIENALNWEYTTNPSMRKYIHREIDINFMYSPRLKAHITMYLKWTSDAYGFFVLPLLINSHTNRVVHYQTIVRSEIQQIEAYDEDPTLDLATGG